MRGVRVVWGIIVAATVAMTGCLGNDIPFVDVCVDDPWADATVVRIDGDAMTPSSLRAEVGDRVRFWNPEDQVVDWYVGTTPDAMLEEEPDLEFEHGPKVRLGAGGCTSVVVTGDAPQEVHVSVPEETDAWFGTMTPFSLQRNSSSATEGRLWSMTEGLRSLADLQHQYDDWWTTTDEGHVMDTWFKVHHPSYSSVGVHGGWRLYASDMFRELPEQRPDLVLTLEGPLVTDKLGIATLRVVAPYALSGEYTLEVWLEDANQRYAFETEMTGFPHHTPLYRIDGHDGRGYANDSPRTITGTWFHPPAPAGSTPPVEWRRVDWNRTDWAPLDLTEEDRFAFTVTARPKHIDTARIELRTIDGFGFQHLAEISAHVVDR